MEHVHRNKLPVVNFVLASESSQEFFGESYSRPEEPHPNLSKNDFRQLRTEQCSVSEQVHLTLGDTSGSIIVSFASQSFSGLVYYSLNQQELESSLQSASYVQTTPFQHSEIFYFNPNSFGSLDGNNNLASIIPIGTANADVETYAQKMDTTAWAFDPVTKERFGMYKKVYNQSVSVTLKNIQAVLVGATPTLSSPVLDYKNPFVIYDSPILHTATIEGLSLGETYYYTVSGLCKIYKFTIPSEHKYPLVLGLTGDMGTTAASNASIYALAALQPAAVLLAGDLCYADGYPSIWDTFGVMIEPVFAQIPLLTTGGNHEFIYGENWMPYFARYPTPHLGSGSANPCYWGRVVGVTNVISLCSYSNFTFGSIQYSWLETYLSTKVNRVATPWVIVMLHVPMYSSNGWGGRGETPVKAQHYMEGELLRKAVEPVLYQYGVDIVLSGHVHAVERTIPLYNNSANTCGMVHLTVGDAGNYEGGYVPWRNTVGLGKNATVQQGGWSAFRESSFGVAGLTIVNATHASYSWNRHSCDSGAGLAGLSSSGITGPKPATTANNYRVNFTAASCATANDNGGYKMIVSDKAWIIRPSEQLCPSKWSKDQTTGLLPMQQLPAGTGSPQTIVGGSIHSKIHSLTITTGVFVAAFAVSVCLNVVLILKLFSGTKTGTSTLVRRPSGVSDMNSV